MFRISGPILVAATLDNRADEPLRQAAAIAALYGVDLHVCHVLPEIYAVRPLFPHLHLHDAFRLREFEGFAGAALADRIRAVTGRDPEQVGIEMEQGTPHAGILRAAERIGAGAVVLGQDLADPEKSPIGGIAERVVRHAHCTVLVTRPPRPGLVLAATDFSEPSLPAVEAAAAEAKRRGTDLAIIHSIDVAPLAAPSATHSIDGMLPVDLVTPMQDHLRDQLDECVRQFEAKGGAILRKGPAAPAILEAAEELPAQLLVLGTHGRTGLKRVALGSVAEKVVRAAPCSVLVVRPAA